MTVPNEQGSALGIAESGLSAGLLLSTGQALPNGAQSDVEGNNAIFNNLFVGNNPIGSGVAAQWQTFNAISMLNNQVTSLPTPTIVFNTAPSIFSLVTTPLNGIRVAVAGIYFWNGSVTINSVNAAATFICGPSLCLNSTSNAYNQSQIYVPASTPAGGSFTLNSTLIQQMNAGDVVGLTCFQNSGVAMTTNWIYLEVAAIH